MGIGSSRGAITGGMTIGSFGEKPRSDRRPVDSDRQIHPIQLFFDQRGYLLGLRIGRISMLQFFHLRFGQTFSADNQQNPPLSMYMIHLRWAFGDCPFEILIFNMDHMALFPIPPFLFVFPGQPPRSSIWFRQR